LREALFIKKNKDRWEEISQFPSSNIDEMADEFTSLVEDLGYAKTFYPHSKVTNFLNAEASKRYIAIYNNRKEEENKIVQFFKTSLPLTIAKHQKVIGICFVFFMVFFFVGFFSAMKDETIVNDILGDSYVKMTEKNIEEGNPFGVYQRDNPFLMWLGIFINNTKVSFTYYLQGIAFFWFAPVNLIENGLMVGSFDYFFYSKGLGGLFILTVMIHGTLELSAIVIAVAACIVLGKSWMFPGTLNRLDAFKVGAKESLKIIIGLVPIFVIAAFFEGFVTRHYKMNPLISGSILLASASFMIFYFGIYPIKVKNKSTKIKGSTA
jgi:uncharacterized membrane protein SpoIIM required for sporulation